MSYSYYFVTLHVLIFILYKYGNIIDNKKMILIMSCSSNINITNWGTQSAHNICRSATANPSSHLRNIAQ